MSYRSFQEACERIRRVPDFENRGGRNEEEIMRAQEALGLRFSQQLTAFYRQIDYALFGGVELFGLSSGAGAKVLEGNSVAYALHDRAQLGLPEEWLPVYNFGDGTLAYLDYSNCDAQGEPCVLRAYYNGDYVVLEHLAEDFGDFLVFLLEYCV